MHVKGWTRTISIGLSLLEYMHKFVAICIVPNQAMLSGGSGEQSSWGDVTVALCSIKALRPISRSIGPTNCFVGDQARCITNDQLNCDLESGVCVHLRFCLLFLPTYRYLLLFLFLIIQKLLNYNTKPSPRAKNEIWGIFWVNQFFECG